MVFLSRFGHKTDDKTRLGPLTKIGISHFASELLPAEIKYQSWWIHWV